MINATVQQGAERPQVAAQATPVRRIGGRIFALLVVAELALLAGVLGWALLQIAPTRTAYSSADAALIGEAVRAHLGGSVYDGLVEVQPGLTVRESNLRGFAYEGTVYYYYVEGGVNYDPLSRGAVDTAGVEILLRDDSGPQTLVIYRIL